MGNAAIAGIETENARSQAQQQAQLEATAQQMQSGFSNELQGDIDAQTGQYIQAQFDAASKEDFALMDAERGVITNGISQYGTGFLEPLATMLNQSSSANDAFSQGTGAGQIVLSRPPTNDDFPTFGRPGSGSYYNEQGHLTVEIDNGIPVKGWSAQGTGDEAPVIAAPYWINKGYFANTYDTAVEGASDSSNTTFQRIVFGALATAEAPLMLVEETARGMLNAPAQATIALQAFRAASTTTDSYQRWNDIAQGLGASGQAILGAIPVAGAVDGTLTRSFIDADARAFPSLTLDGGARVAAQTLSFSTAPGQAYFWSAMGRGGDQVAAEIAMQRGGTTLEQLVQTRGIDLPVWDAENPASINAWGNASRSYAEGASGDVHVILGNSPRPGNTWETVELPALRSNPNVTRVIKIDPASGQESVIFERGKQ